MIDTTLPYLRQASQGYPQTSRVYQPAPVQNYRQAPIDITEQMRAALANTGRLQTPGVTVQNVRNSYMGNLNPSLQGGIADVGINGEVIRAPNALVQQLMFQDAFNAGRSNSLGDFFGGQNQNPQGLGYSTIGADQQRAEQFLYANPQLTQQRALNPFTAAREQQAQDYGRLQQAQAQMGAPRTEKLSANGQMVDDGGQAQRQKELDAAQSQYNQSAQEWQRQNGRGGARRGNDTERAAMDSITAGFQPVRPTYSNLPIKERLA